MATIDLSRSATDFRKHFTSVRTQMGRVLTEDDHNDNERLHGEDERRSRVHIIGPAGSPDDGFSIKNPTVTGGKIDFDITPGTFYLGGHRLDLEQVERFQVQSDWVNMAPADMPAPPTTTPRFDLVYLEAWQQAVSAVEDSELFEVALGGPDTSTRIRLMRRVRVATGGATGDCHKDWATVLAGWSAAGLGTLNDQAELVVDTRLKVGFAPGTNPADLCSPPVAGGYLGAENQAIRVQLVDATHFTWGFDNASPLYRVTVGPNAVGQMRKITLQTEPKDQAHWPLAGQIVELLPWSAVLANKERIAEVSGFLARVEASYDPDTHELFLTTDVPAGFGQAWKSRPDAADLQPEFLYMRVWNRGSDILSPVSIPFVTGTPVTLGNTGLTVTFTGSDHHPADYWIIAARPEAPNHVVPWLLESGRGPHGIRRYSTPLAVVQWTPAVGGIATGVVVHDCREKFPPLTRIRTCCTYTVGDGTTSFGNFTSIQKAIDALPADGGEVCVLPGVYPENIHIAKRHDVSVHGCGRRSVLMDDGSAKAPVITIEDSQRIAIHDLAIQAPAVVGIQLTSTTAAEANKAGLDTVDLDDLEITVRDFGAIDGRGGRNIRIRRNELVAQQLAAVLVNTSPIGKSPLVFVRADDVLVEKNRLAASADRRLVLAAGGLHIGGGSERVTVRRNKILGGNGNGVTLGSVSLVAAAGGPIGGGGGIIVFPGFTFTIDDNGCIHLDPNPQPPKDPNGNPLTPVSDGDLLDIRILENDILDMGLNGIASLYMNLPQLPFIVVRDLDVEGNRIRKCVQLGLGDAPFPPGTPIGYGGVSLVAVEELMLRDNWIEANGHDFIDPICGVFVQIGRGLAIENNVIADNGPRVETNKQPTNGPRGGIVILFALTSFLAVPPGTTALRHGAPAARIAGNSVVAPLGRALWLGAWGVVSVEGNQLASHGVDRDSNPFGVTVTILDIGVSWELAGLFVGYTNLGLNQPKAFGLAAAEIHVGGEVLFNDNQVVLAPPGDPVVVSSILIMTADDVSFGGNMSECRMGQGGPATNAIVFGWSVRMSDSRFQEALTAPGFSAYTFAGFNSTTDNQGTRCFLSVGLPKLSSRAPNRSLVNLYVFGVDPCKQAAALVTAALKGTGFDAEA